MHATFIQTFDGILCIDCLTKHMPSVEFAITVKQWAWRARTWKMERERKKSEAKRDYVWTNRNKSY